MLIAALGVGIGSWAPGISTSPSDAAPAQAANEKSPTVPIPQRYDLYGDPLPEGATLRLGTLQRRAVWAELALTADGKDVISARRAKYVCVWDVEKGKLRTQRTLPTRASHLATLSPKGRYLATDSPNGFGVWEVETGELVHTVAFADMNVKPGLFSNDERRVAAVGSRWIRS